MYWWQLLVSLAAGYIFGCFSTGTVVGKLYKTDVRQYGSKNVGATNTLRVLGVKAGLLTLAGDVLKCVIPCLLIRMVIFKDLIGDDMYLYQLFTLITCIGTTLGHDYPASNRFKGGKGAACLCAAAFLFDLRVGIVGIIFFVLMVVITKYVSVGSMSCSIYFSTVSIIMGANRNVLYVLCCLFFAAFVIFLHTPNIKRLMNHCENKFSIGGKKKETEK